MTTEEAVLHIVSQMEEEANGIDQEEFAHTAAALHRYARMLSAVCRDKQVIKPNDVGLLNDMMDMEK